MKTVTTAFYLLITVPLSEAPVSGAPTPQVELYTVPPAVRQRALGGHGCTPDGRYFVSANGIDILFECEGRCQNDGNGQPRCNNAIVSSTEEDPDAVPFPVVPAS